MHISHQFQLEAKTNHLTVQLHSEPANPPTGYTYVPSGNVYVSRHCRSVTNASGQPLYIVFNPARGNRVGMHVPVAIHDQVQTNAAATADSRQQAVLSKDNRDKEKARATLCSLFPRIPSEDSDRVLDHAYLKGSGRVGRSGKITDVQKMKLAVVAHIRHEHTNYDELLQRLNGPAKKKNKAHRDQARRTIAKDIEKKLKEWGPLIRANKKVEVIELDNTTSDETDPEEPVASGFTTRSGRQPSKPDPIRALVDDPMDIDTDLGMAASGTGKAFVELSDDDSSLDSFGLLDEDDDDLGG